MSQEQTPLPFTPHEAWEHMRKTLDREMPEKKRRRRRFIFWLLPLLTGGILLFWPNGGEQERSSGKTTGTMESTPANKPGNPATPIQTNQQRLAASVIPVQSQKNNVVNTTSNNEQTPVQNNNPLRTGKNQPPVHTTPRLLTVRTVQEKKVKRLPVEPDAEQADAEFLWEVNPVLNNNSNETAVKAMEEEVVPDDPLAIQSPILHQAPDAPVLAALTMQEVQTPFSIKAITIKPRLPKRPVYFGIRTGWVLNHTGWAAKKQPLFPQRLLPLEFYIEQPLNRKMSLELGVNLFSSRNIQYGLQRQESGTDVATGRFHLRNEKYTAQALHFTDVQLLLHRNSNSNWRLHGGVYFSVLKNIAVEVNRYDSTSKPTPTGSSFESTTTTGYTYARKLNEVNLVAPFRKSDMGLLAGIGYRGKLWEAGLSTQVGLPKLYQVTSDAIIKGKQRTLQIKCWVGLRLKGKR